MITAARRPQRHDAGTQTGECLDHGTPAGGLAGEQELPTPALLLAPKQPGAGQQSPYRTEDHEGHRYLEHGEAGDGLEVRGRSEQGAGGLVGAVGGGQSIPLRLGLVDRGVADG